MRFAIASVPATTASDDGQTVTLRLLNAQGVQLDIEAHYTILEVLSNALHEASAKAHRARRQRSPVDESMAMGSEGFVLAHYRFGVADDKSAMRLSLQTSIGPVEMLLPAEKAAEFVAEANQHLEMLKAPPFHQMS